MGAGGSGRNGAGYIHPPAEFPPDFLDAIDRAVMDRGGRVQGENVLFRCPIPGHEDTNPSASWHREKAVWTCFRCNPEGADAGALALADLLGIEKPDRSRKDTPKPTAKRIVATYDYLRDGEIVFQVVRYEPKGFSQRRPGPNGWVYNLSGITPFLYHRDELENADLDAWVYLCAGEKDADRLRALGLIATTNPMGEGKWRDIYTETLRGRRVAILEDNDAAGRTHAEKVAAALSPVCTAVKVLKLPDLPAKGDVSDYLDAGHDAADLEAFRESVPEWTPPAPLTAPLSPVFNTTDTGNAERLVHRYGEDIRYSYERGKWYVWSGTHWQEDTTGRMDQLAKQTVRAIPQEAENASGEDFSRLMKWAASSESAGKRSAMIELARSEDGVPVTTERLDADPWLLNVANGTVDLRTGTLQAHDREDLMTRCLSTPYDPEARCPTFLAFLDRIFAGKADVIAYLQRMIGYSLTGSTREQVVFILHGLGANGKSTLVSVIASVLEDYAQEADTDSFLEQKGSQIREDLAALDGARFVPASETADGRRLSEAFVKKATGGEKIRARRLFENGYLFTPRFKLWLSTNHRPNIIGTDHAIWRRIRLIPFAVTIPERERDKDLPAKLEAERAGILAWAIEGCRRWLAEGENPPAEVLSATDLYRRDMDALANWLEDRCVIDSTARETAKALYSDYTAYCETSGEDALKQRTFGTRLTERGFGSEKSGSSRYRTGLRLKTDDEPDDTSQMSQSGTQGTDGTPFPASSLGNTVYAEDTENRVPNVPYVPNEAPSLLSGERVCVRPSCTNPVPEGATRCRSCSFDTAAWDRQYGDDLEAAS